MAILVLFQLKKGYEFESDTDTETIVKLAKHVFDTHEGEPLSFRELVETTIQQLVRTRSSWRGGSFSIKFEANAAI